MTKNKINMDKLYDYLFHYNPFEKVWYAFKREDYMKYFNGDRSIIFKNKEVGDLIIEILDKNKKK